MNNGKVLVADDDAFIRKLLNEFLSFYEYNVECVGSGEDALRLIETGHYDILITDYMMPGINGAELIRQIRNQNLSLPIIGISGSVDEKDFLSAGANFFMPKPLELTELKYAIERIFLL